jgi:hypothetical protein
MLPVVPTEPLGGVPVIAPVCWFKAAQDGRFVALNCSASPLASLAVGVKLYEDPAVTEVVGWPEMVGAELLAVAAEVPGELATEALSLPLPPPHPERVSRATPTPQISGKFRNRHLPVRRNKEPRASGQATKPAEWH